MSEAEGEDWQRGQWRHGDSGCSAAALISSWHESSVLLGSMRFQN